ncbi:MAG: glutamate-5-semialdehyde dehydrogenase [Nitrososphaerota archaeon]|nr:glutamate-5-semialdehyde dehydrogenase [Nitrososphaerota archaeon]
MLTEICKKAKLASAELAQLSTEKKNKVLREMASSLERDSERILTANHKDVEAAKREGRSAALLDRLALDERKIKKMSQCLKEIAELPDPIGEIVKTWSRPNGLIIGQMRVPLGVVGVIYESRPDVTSDASGICLKSGNAAILRGGSDAINSNLAIGESIKSGLVAAGVPSYSIQVVSSTDRGIAEELMQMRDYIDVLIPRGGSDLIKTVVEKATIPVIETGLGNCHIYVESDADLDKAVNIIVNAKCQRPGTCNAAEKLLVNEGVARNFVPRVIEALRAKGVEIRGDKETMKIVPDVKLATEEDWHTEYLDLKIGIKIVRDLREAVSHINTYGTKNSDAILTANFEKAQQFIRAVDSAAVYWNASTRFTDGNQFGFGAEIGISTQKMHARGPMSVEQLTSTKYFILGSGQIRE